MAAIALPMPTADVASTPENSELVYLLSQLTAVQQRHARELVEFMQSRPDAVEIKQRPRCI